MSTLPFSTSSFLESFKKRTQKGFGGGTKQGGINAEGYGSRIGMDPDSMVTMDWKDSDGDGIDDRTQRAPGTPAIGWDQAKAEDKKKFGRGGSGRGKKGRGRDGRGVDSFNPFQDGGNNMKTGWLDFYNKQRSGFTADGNWTGKGKAPKNALFSSAPSPETLTLRRSSLVSDGFGGTTQQGGAKQTTSDGKVPSDFGQYNPATFGGNLYNQGWGNMVNWGNKFKDNKAIQGFISGARLDANQTMMNMGMDLLYQKGQMSQMADYHGGMENLKTGNTLKLLSAEGGITRDLMWDQGDILSRQIGERGDQDRRTLRATGQENRALVITQGDQDRRGLRVKGQEQRAGIYAQGDQDRRGLRVQGEEQRAGIYAQGDQDRMGLRVKGQEQRAGIYAQGDQDRRGMRVRGQEERASIMTTGKEDRKGMRVKGQEDRLGMRVSGEEDRLGMRVSGEEERLGMRVSGEEERAGMRTKGTQTRMTIGAQGIQDRLLTKTKGREDRLGQREQGLQDRMLTQERGSEDRKTQRDRYREDRAMRADARGAIRRSGSRFFG